MFTCKSVSRENVAYQWQNESISNTPDYYYSHCAGYVSPSVSEYDTYGDGMVQHSPAILTRNIHFLDCMQSLAKYVFENPADIHLIMETLSPRWPYHEHVSSLRFYSSLKYNEKKPDLIYNTRLLKVQSKKKSIKHGEVWEDLHQYMDGSLKKCAMAMFESHWSFLQCFAATQDLRDYRLNHNEGDYSAWDWSEWWHFNEKVDFNECRRWFVLVTDYVNAWRAKRDAEDCYRRMTT